ncbi:hypothetical protein ACWGIU_34245, partial [Streptomyces sp. NPDC054840]
MDERITAVRAADAENARRRPAPEPPQWWIEYGIGVRRTPERVHTGDCRMGSMEALRSAGPANSPTVTDAQFTVLEEELGKGPSAHGFDDERWTLAR